MKDMLIAVTVAVAILLLVFGGDKVWSYVKGGQKVIQEGVETRTPMHLENARIRALMETEADKLEGERIDSLFAEDGYRTSDISRLPDEVIFSHLDHVDMSSDCSN